MLKDFVDFVIRLFTQRAAGLAAAAFIIDLVVLSVCVILTSPSIQFLPTVDLHIAESSRLYFVFGFLLFFPIIWYILYIQTEKALIDIYSSIREKMTGNWLVIYSAAVADDGRIIVPERAAKCEIRENLIKKLEMSFSIPGNNPIFDPQQIQSVKDIALRANEQGGYTVFYYYETVRKLTGSIRDLLIQGDPQRHGIEIEVFGIMTFPDPQSKSKVSEMTGKWYDLNGNMMRILQLVDMHERAIYAKQHFEPMDFHKIPISDIHFDSDMGDIRFSYQGN